MSSNRLSLSLIVISLLLLTSCGSLKKAVMVGATSLGTGAIVSTVTSGTAPVLLATAGSASVVSATADLLMDTKFKTGISKMECAPDNFWSLLGSLVEIGGWFLLLLILVPMVMGWILPGPLRRKKKEDA